MISRRGLFKMLGAVAASPALKPLAKLMPETYTTYLVGKDVLVSVNKVSYRYEYVVGSLPAITKRVQYVAIPTFQKAPNPEFVYWRKPE